MSRLEKKINRANKLKARKEAKKKYEDERELGPCFVKDCQNNGDLITHCNFCDFKVQACTGHNPDGRNKAKRHLLLKHPAKTVPTVIAGVLGGRSLD